MEKMGRDRIGARRARNVPRGTLRLGGGADYQDAGVGLGEGERRVPAEGWGEAAQGFELGGRDQQGEASGGTDQANFAITTKKK